MAGELGKIDLSNQPLGEVLAKYTVPELQQELKRRGLKRSGVKAKLIHRLIEAIESEEGSNNDIDEIENREESEGESHEEKDTKQTLDLHDPYAEFERSIPGVNEDADIDKEGQAEVSLNSEKEEQYEMKEAGEVEEEGEKEAIEEINIPEDQATLLESRHENREDGEFNKEEQVTAKGQTNEERESFPVREEQQSANVGIDFQEESIYHEDLKEESASYEQTKQEEDDEEEPKTDDSIPKGHEYQEEFQRNGAGEDSALEQESAQEQNREGDTVLVDNEDQIEVNFDKNEVTENFDENKESPMKSTTVVIPETKPAKKPTAPVQLKKRKINVAETGSSEKQEAPVPRKRRWGSSTNKESVIISTDSLKGLIPEVSVIPSPNDDPLGLGLDYGDMEEGEIDETIEAEGSQPAEDADDKGNEEIEETDDGTFKKEVRRGRIVRISTKDTIKLQRIESKEETSIKEELKADKEEIEITIPDEKVSLLPEVSSEDPDFVRERLPSPAKNDPSKILSVRNLVRPFTLRQLREFLSKSGTVVEDGFWIDRVKSHCYVTYATEDEAIASRSAIHGTRWPAANPKLLSADFAVNDEMYRETGGKLGKALSPVKIEEIKPIKERAPGQEDRRRERDRSKDKDKEKIERKRERLQGDDSVKPKEKKEAPGKLLDDLFRKTKATPCIYWLPLTKQQIADKERQREERREERRKVNEDAAVKETKEREERRKQRETEVERNNRVKGRISPKRYRERQARRSGSREGARPTGNDNHQTRQLPAQYRKARELSSSSSDSDVDNRAKFATRR